MSTSRRLDVQEMQEKEVKLWLHCMLPAAEKFALLGSPHFEHGTLLSKWRGKSNWKEWWTGKARNSRHVSLSSLAPQWHPPFCDFFAIDISYKVKQNRHYRFKDIIFMWQTHALYPTFTVPLFSILTLEQSDIVTQWFRLLLHFFRVPTRPQNKLFCRTTHVGSACKLAAVCICCQNSKALSDFGDHLHRLEFCPMSVSLCYFQGW